MKLRILLLVVVFCYSCGGFVDTGEIKSYKYDIIKNCFHEDDFIYVGPYKGPDKNYDAPGCWINKEEGRLAYTEDMGPPYDKIQNDGYVTCGAFHAEAPQNCATGERKYSLIEDQDPEADGDLLICSNGACSSYDHSIESLFDSTNDKKIYDDHLNAGSINDYGSYYEPISKSHGYNELLDYISNNSLTTEDEIPLFLLFRDNTNPDWDTLAQIRRDSSQREAWIQARRNSLDPYQTLRETYFEDLGITNYERFWLVDGHTLIAKVEDIPNLISMNNLIAISMDPDNEPLSNLGGEDNYNGQDISDVTRLEHLHLASLYGEGLTSSHSDNWKAAVIEPSSFLRGYHPAFKDYGSYYRVNAHNECTRFSCQSTPFVSASSSAETHGTWVTGLLAGGIIGGLDPNITDTTQEKMRSWVATEASIYYYKARNRCARSKAIEKSVEDGADVINMSWHMKGYLRNDTWAHPGDCRLINWNICGMNEIIYNAHSSGVNLVKSAGNENNDIPPCNVSYPGNRLEALSVGALVTPSGTFYNDTALNTGSSRGVKTINGLSSSLQIGMVDLVAPAKLILAPTVKPIDYSTAIGSIGTSFAAPLVSGGLLLTREWMEKFGWVSANLADSVFAQMLLMGDGYSEYSSGALDSPNASLDFNTGAGRLKLARPDMTQNNGLFNDHIFSWGSFYGLIGQNQTIDINISGSATSAVPTSVNGLKVALFYRDKDFRDVPRIDLELVEGCGSPSTRTQVANTLYANVLKAVLYVKDESLLRNKCIFVRLRGEALDYPRSFALGFYSWKASDFNHIDVTETPYSP